MSTFNTQPIVKRAKALYVFTLKLMGSFFQSMSDTVNKNAIPIIEKQAQLDVPKKRLFSIKKLSQGVITSAEKICHCAKDELRNHLEHRGTKQTFQYFQEYVKDYFDAIVLKHSLCVRFNHKDIPGRNKTSSLAIAVSGLFPLLFK